MKFRDSTYTYYPLRLASQGELDYLRFSNFRCYTSISLELAT